MALLGGERVELLLHRGKLVLQRLEVVLGPRGRTLRLARCRSARYRDAGRLRAQLKGKSAEVDMAIEAYNGLVIDAVREVADQIAALQSIRAQSREQQDAQAKAQALYDIAIQRFSVGLSNRSSVLGAQSAVLAQQRQAIELRARALDAQALLMRATAGSLAAVTQAL